jgi:RimJ/RimL family protein N-acetyltransferase
LALRRTLNDRSREAGPPGDWRRRLPVLRDGPIALRALRESDAAALAARLGRRSVQSHLAPSPSSPEGFRRFVRWTNRQRRNGTHICYGVVPAGKTTLVGIVQVWPIERDFFTAEWGVVLGEEYWGTGLFQRVARPFLNFAFGTLGVVRLEARTAEANVRANRALRKLGATFEGVLRSGYRNGDTVGDHLMWSILASDWASAKVCLPATTTRPR